MVFHSRAKSYGNNEVIALDSSTFEAQGTGLKSGRKSIHKDKLIKNVYKVVTLYSMSSRAPIAFAKIPGNIPDSMTVPNALKLLSSLHMDKAEVVTDNGYYSEDNILEMIRQGFGICHLRMRNMIHIRMLGRKIFMSTM